MFRTVGLLLIYAGLATALQQDHAIISNADALQWAHDRSMLTDEFPFYHTSDELLAQVKKLKKTCTGVTLDLQSVHDSNVTIDTVRVKKVGATPVNKVFVLFGEHSRELISPESGLTLLKMLCGQEKAQGSVDAADALRTSEFFMVLNANPISRRKVEEGDYCLRVNENGVDLNRNWDARWQADASYSEDTNPGSAPFSEPETRMFKDLLVKYKPTTFLTIHSGTFGMYMPWAYDTEHIGTRNQKPMLDILEDVDSRHCECPFGSAGKEVGYACPGTCLDYAYDVEKTPFAFAFEIYTSPEYEQALKNRWNDKKHSGGHSLIQSGEHLAHPHFHDLFHHHRSDFVHLEQGATTSLRALRNLAAEGLPAQSRRLESPAKRSTTEFDCFRLFNPPDEESFNATTINWASAYLEVASLVADRLASGKKIEFLSKSLGHI